MDELLEELGVSYDDLYKLHTGHHVHKESDDDDSSDDSGSLEENHKPPLYSFDEISEAQTVAENTTNSSVVQEILDSDDIFKKLSLSISGNYCFICKKKSRRHYTKPKHYKKVKLWLLKELAQISAEVKLRNFFCEICNLALCGNDLAQNHYESKDHIYKAKNFCLPCLRSIPECNMPDHLKSRRHETKFLKNSSSLETNVKQESKNPISVVNIKNEYIEDGKKMELVNQVFDENASNTDGIKTIDLGLRCTANKDLGHQNKYRTIANNGDLAYVIMSVLIPSFCYICYETIKGSHYNAREHNKSLETWIDSYARSCGFDIKDMDELICFCCHAIFPNTNYADIHYGSSGHLSKSRTFCNVCLQHIVGTKGEGHDKGPEHKKLKLLREKEKERKQKNVPLESPMKIDPVCNEIFLRNRSSSLKIHGISINIIRELIEDKTDKCDPIPKSVIELMTPTYCFICNKSALKNNSSQFRHYTYKTHQTALKKLLHSKDCDVDQIYCEACNEVLLNNKLAKYHYKSSEHKTTCNLSKINDLWQNLVVESKTENESICHPTLINDLRTNNKENVVQSGIIIADKLKDMLLPIFCHVCKRNVNMHIFNHHYLERDHTVKLRNWLNGEIKKLGVKIDRNILYCEDCSLELGGTNEDLKHYETISHQSNKKRYCSICIFRGTPTDLVEHISTKQHKDNSRKLINSTKKESGVPSWPKELTALITLNECKVCGLKLQTTEKADFHYCSERHNINIRIWLDRYNQSNNADNITNGNNKMFCCTFCESSFTSEQELNDHNNFHFPTLGGTNGHKSPKKLRTKSKNPKTTSEPKEQKDLFEEVAIDKPVLSTPTKQHVNQSVSSLVKQSLDGKRNENEYTKLHKEIRIEINKLINTVCVLKPLPFEESLLHLTELNKKLAAYKSSTVQNEKICDSFEKLWSDNELKIKTNTESSWDTEKIILNSPSTSHIEETLRWDVLNIISNRVESTKQKYAETKLSMEICRLKMVLGNKNKIQSDLAFKYVQNLNQLLENLIDSGSRQFDIDVIFEANTGNFVFSETDTLQGHLQLELDKLCGSLLNAKKIDVEVALDFITQFNVQLESFLQYEEEKTYIYSDLSD